MPLLKGFAREEYQARIQAVAPVIKASGWDPWVGEFEGRYDLAKDGKLVG